MIKIHYIKKKNKSTKQTNQSESKTPHVSPDVVIGLAWIRWVDPFGLRKVNCNIKSFL